MQFNLRNFDKRNSAMLSKDTVNKLRIVQNVQKAKKAFKSMKVKKVGFEIPEKMEFKTKRQQIEF